MEMLYAPRPDSLVPSPTRHLGHTQLTCFTVDEGSKSNTGPTYPVPLFFGSVPLEMVKLCDKVSEVRNRVMLWKRVGELADCVDGGQGSLPLPETSIAT